MSQASSTPRDAAASAIESLGARLRREFPALRVHLCSLHDEQGDVLWLSEGFLGPDEHCAVLHAYERFAGRGAPPVVVDDLGDGRCAAVLRAKTPQGAFAGAAMVIVDAKNARGDGAMSAFRTAGVEALLTEFAGLLAPTGAPHAAASGDAGASRAVDTGATAIGRRINLPIPASQVDPEVDRLFAALRRTAIALHVQRLVPLRADDDHRRFEVLLRSGAEFNEAPHKMLARATKAGLASMIDRRVVTMLLGWAIRHRAEWMASPATFSVNLSATALRDEHFGRFLELCLAKATLPAGTISFEISEAACLGHATGFAALAALLERLGSPIAIDDFSGSGRALELLRVRGVRMLKFSDEFTATIATDAARRSQVEAFLQMTRALDVRTVAKRVNDPATRALLAGLGVDFLQSYAASAPCALDSLVVARARDADRKS